MKILSPTFLFIAKIAILSIVITDFIKKKLIMTKKTAQITPNITE